jgi:hypothetical protein
MMRNTDDDEKITCAYCETDHSPKWVYNKCLEDYVCVECAVDLINE